MSGEKDWKSKLTLPSSEVQRQKLVKLENTVNSLRNRNRAWIAILFAVFIAFSGILLMLLWHLGVLDLKARADIANVAIATALAVVSLLVDRLPTIDQEAVQGAYGKLVTKPVLNEMRSHIGPDPERIKKWVALIAAITLIGIVIMKNVSSTKQVSSPKGGNDATSRLPLHGRHLSTLR